MHYEACRDCARLFTVAARLVCTLFLIAFYIKGAGDSYYELRTFQE